MSHTTHEDILREYEKRIQRAIDRRQERIAEVYEKISGVEALDDNIAALGLNYNKNILLGRNAGEDLVQLNRQMEELKAQKQQKLVAAGFPPDYLELQYLCKSCQDSGFIQTQGGGFEKCHCYKQQIINAAYSKSNLNRLETQNFASFDIEKFSDEVNEQGYKIPMSPRENMRSIVETCHQFIDNFEKDSCKSLLFMGPTGVGKTFMSNCIAKELMDRGKTVLYLTAPKLFDLVNHYRTSGWDRKEAEESSYHYIMESDLLIIDDLGIEPVSTAKNSEFLTILNTRAANNSKKPCKLLISTNLSFMALEELYRERIVSRIIGDFTLLKFAGEDIRRLPPG